MDQTTVEGTRWFQTQVIWQRRADPPDFSLAFGSCAYINDPSVDSTTAPPYGGGYEIFETIAQTEPDLMLWLGDAIYLRPADWSSPSGIHRRYRHARRLPDKPYWAERITMRYGMTRLWTKRCRLDFRTKEVR